MTSWPNCNTCSDRGKPGGCPDCGLGPPTKKDEYKPHSKGGPKKKDKKGK